jgi:hypothetical protein
VGCAVTRGDSELEALCLCMRTIRVEEKREVLKAQEDEEKRESGVHD